MGHLALAPPSLVDWFDFDASVTEYMSTSIGKANAMDFEDTYSTSYLTFFKIGGTV